MTQASTINPSTTGQRADIRVKTLLLEQLQKLEAQLPGVIANENQECLHEFRIAIRKSRTILGQFKHVLPASIYEKNRLRLALLSEISGPARDLDVWLAEFENQDQESEATSEQVLEPLHQALHELALSSHESLTRQLKGQAVQRSINAWRKYLSSPPPKRPSAPSAKTPIATLVNEKIWNLCKRIFAFQNADQKVMTLDQYHDLRKLGKKLRYLLEFFGKDYPSEDIARFLTRLKKLQTVLGELQDLQARKNIIKRIIEKMRFEQTIQTEVLIATGNLIVWGEKREAKLLKKFERQYKSLTSRDNKRLCKKLFNPKAV